MQPAQSLDPSRIVADVELGTAVSDFAKALVCRSGLLKAAFRFQCAKERASSDAVRSADQEIGTVLATQTFRPAQAPAASF
jgi:hypothetical protein